MLLVNAFSGQINEPMKLQFLTPRRLIRLKSKQKDRKQKTKKQLALNSTL